MVTGKCTLIWNYTGSMAQKKSHIKFCLPFRSPNCNRNSSYPGEIDIYAENLISGASDEDSGGHYKLSGLILRINRTTWILTKKYCFPDNLKLEFSGRLKSKCFMEDIGQALR